MKHLLPAFILVFFFSCGNTDPQTTDSAITTSEATLPVDRNTQPTEKLTDELALKEKELASTEVRSEKITSKTESVPSTEVAQTSLQNQPSTMADKKPASPTKLKQPKVITEPVERDGTRSEADVPSTRTTPAPVEIKETLVEEVTEKPVAAPVRPDHSAWNSLLSSYVSGTGTVNYSGLKADTEKLDAYLAELAKATPDGSWNKREAMAYWMNAYNAFTVKLILNNWPVKSIMDLHGGKPWDVKWIELAGKTYSLNGIEHGILRPVYGDPRIHFAVNCAAQSCPPIHNRAFTASNLNGKLESLANSFINNSKYNEIGTSEVKVSSIFDWYGKDFGDVKNYLNKYSTTKIDAATPIEFKEYDWALNGK